MRAPEGSPKDAIWRNRLAYTRIAAEWERRAGEDFDHEFHDRCRGLFLSHLRGNRVLDVGCGLGLDSLAFAAAGLRVTASDIVTDLLVMIRSKTSEILLAAMDMTAPCFGARCFDGIYAYASFLHVPRELAAQTLAGFSRMLAPGGVLFLHHAASMQGLEGYSLDSLLILDNPAVCYCHAQIEITGLLESAGFRVLAFSHFRPRRHPSPCAIRAGLIPYQLIAAKRAVPPPDI